MKRRKLKNKFLKAVTWSAGIGVIVSACCLDSESNIPLYICIACAAWLCLMIAANAD